MLGTDAARCRGLTRQVNLPLVRVFGNALPFSVFRVGVQLSQIASFGQGFDEPSAVNVLSAALTQDLVSAGPTTRWRAHELKAVRSYLAIVLKGRVPSVPHTALTVCMADYPGTTGQVIEAGPLILQMLQQFVDTDRDFQRVTEAEAERALHGTDRRGGTRARRETRGGGGGW